MAAMSSSSPQPDCTTRHEPHRTQHRRRSVTSLPGLLLAGLLALLVPVLMATTAQAHAVLVSISPADGAQLAKAPTQVVLTFDEAVSTSFATVAVTGPSGGSVVSGRATVDGAKVTQALKSGLTSGTYSVAYRVVSDDGHPVSDRTTFTLTLPAASTPAASTPAPSPSSTSTAATPTSSASASPTTQNAASPTGSDTAGGLPAWGWVVIAIAVLAVVGGGAAAVGSRRRQGH